MSRTRCHLCRDSGLAQIACRPYARCARPKCKQLGDNWYHTDVEPCRCVAGDRLRAKAYQESAA